MPSFFPWTSSSHNRRSSHSRPGSTYSSHSRDSYGYSRSASGSGSYYKRRPRDGFIQRLIYRLKHLLRELWYYARRNPVKVFFLVVMPLISGGVLAGVARQFGIRLPGFLMGRAAQGRSFGGGYYGSQGYGSEAGGAGGLGGLAEGLAGGGGMGSLMNMAKMFM